MKKDTLITEVGRAPEENFGVVNPPVHRASTIIFPTVAAMEEAYRTPFDGVVYGRRGTPVTFALEEAMAALEGGYRGIALPSGLSAITTSLLAFLKSGDHLLMADTAYEPAREFCEHMLRGLGVEITYYDPMIGGAIAQLMQPNTRVVYVESPGSLTFEVQDLPAIAEAAHAAGAPGDVVVLADNTWSGGYYYRPLEHGADVAIQAGTKYIVGHSDVMMGLVVTTEEAFMPVKLASHNLGIHVSPDDCYLALRGLRTLGVRMPRHQQTALTLADWLEQRPEVAKVLHPAFPGTPGHEFWKRDFSGSSGLFSILLNKYSKKAVTAMVEGMGLFTIGFSWGGFESLILPVSPEETRTATRWAAEGPLVRLHAGLEDADDLIDDLEKGLARLNAA